MSIHPWDVEGGPAFPVVLKNDQIEFKGMSLRDWFAGQALVGLFAGRGGAELKTTEEDFLEDARGAYQIADCMLAARKTEAA